MKLKLPTLLLGLLLAGTSAQATETIDLNNYQWTYETQYARICTDSNLTISGYCKLGEETVHVPQEPYEITVYGGLYWQSSSTGSFSLTGLGVLDCEGGNFTIVGECLFPSEGGAPSQEMGQSKYTIESGIQLRGTYLEAQNDAQVVFRGSIYSGRPSDPEELWQCEFYVGDTSSLDLTDAQIKDTDYVNLNICVGGTVICSNYTVSETHGLDLEGAWATVFPSGTLGDRAGTLQGNLTLSGGGRVYVQYARTHGASGFDSPGTYKFSTLTVTGTVNVAGKTKITFFNENFAPDPVTGGEQTICSYVSPEVNDVVLYCQSYTGDASLLSVEEGRYNSNNDREEFRLNQELKLAFVPQADGRYALTVVETGNVPVVPEKPGTVITSGEAPETLDSNTVIELAPDGCVDATAVTRGLDNTHVSGQGGTLTTAADQTFAFSQAGAIGFDIVGVDESTPGAFLQVGAPGGSSAAVYQLNGSSYRTTGTRVDSGLLLISEDTSLSTGDFVIANSSVNRTAAVTNNGVVEAVQVALKRGAVLANRGLLTGNVVAEDGAALTNEGVISGLTTVRQGAVVQGSGSFDKTVVEQGGVLSTSTSSSAAHQQHASLTFLDVAVARFNIDGSSNNALIRADTLTLNGVATANVVVGLGLLSQGGTDISVNLVQANTSEGEGHWTLRTQDENHLLKEGSAKLSWSSGVLTFTAEIDSAAVAALAGQDGANIANALWSSANTVQNFARHALDQLQQPGSGHVWVSGLGSFMDLGADGQISGFRYNGGGYALGSDYACTETFSAGIALGQEFGRFRSDDHQARIRQESLMAGLYARYREELDERRAVGVSAYAAFGTVENEADTSVGGEATLPGHGSWDDTVWTFGLKGEWEQQLSGGVVLAPYMGLEYVHGAQDDFEERFAAGHRAWRNGGVQVWRLPVGAALKGVVSLGGDQSLLPELSLGYVGDIARQAPHVESSLYGISQRHKGSEPGRSAFQLRVGTNWIMSREWSAGAFYSLEARSGQTSQAASVSVRYSF